MGANDDGQFTVPWQPVRRHQGLPAFVVNRGGEYGFMPGLRALRWPPTSTPNNNPVPNTRRFPMADHFSGPRALSDPAADITDFYVFPSPERPGQLTLVLDVFPTAAPTALFSE
jgi:hypothetical protein